MVYDKNFNEDEQQIVYDLRMIYAEKILGNTLIHIQIARNEENYILWYHLLKRDLLTEISKNLRPEELIKVKEKIKETKEILCTYPNAYMNNKKSYKSADENEAVEDALCDLEMLLMALMEKHKLFGAKQEAELM